MPVLLLLVSISPSLSRKVPLPNDFSLLSHSSTWTARPSLYLEDLFVLPQYRNLGIGKSLFRSLSTIAQEKNCGRMDWSVLDWNENSIRFYKDVLKAKSMDGWTGMRLEEEGIRKLGELE